MDSTKIDQIFISVITSRMMEIKEYINNDQPTLKPSFENECSRCRTFSFIMFDCHACGWQHCRNCISYFFLNEKYCRNSERKLPVLVCWSCHDLGIYTKFTTSDMNYFIGMRRKYVVKKINDQIVLFHPSSVVDVNAVTVPMCFICDQDKIEANCQICGELFCKNCILSIPVLPEDFRLSLYEVESKICNECHFKINGNFQLGTLYSTCKSWKSFIRKFNSNRFQKNIKEIPKHEIRYWINISRKLNQLPSQEEIPPPTETPESCHICHASNSNNNCHICCKKVCNDCKRDFRVPNTRDEIIWPLKDNLNKSSAGFYSGACCNISENNNYYCLLKPVCLKCHEIVIKVRYVCAPVLKPIRSRPLLRYEESENKILTPSFPGEVSKERCYFCLEKIPVKDSNDDSQSEPVEKEAPHECSLCGEWFCAKDAKQFDFAEEYLKNNFVCFECRFLIISHNLSVEHLAISYDQMNKNFNPDDVLLISPPTEESAQNDQNPAETQDQSINEEQNQPMNEDLAEGPQMTSDSLLEDGEFDILINIKPIGISFKKGGFEVAKVEKGSQVDMGGVKAGHTLVRVNDLPATIDLVKGDIPMIFTFKS